ncbi:polysaccharide pyruvyl transferase family protein [uncultured Algibacter sp.]|uniref:polysaccharide pyruvyl transferase family protein n=1 Tax=uncultured Algibacter sp. TaxID=298659 RepID=UPI00261F3FC8|nr:polysaccharide pyruvyl transferase family protein [uncultured Algibacter sp.]
MKYVEIKGIGFPNKGAELLLCATLEQIKPYDMTVCMEPYSPFSYKINYPIATKTSIYKWGLNLLFPLNFLPSYITNRLGFVKPSQVDLILDASGFAYGDDWSISLAKSRILSENTSAKIVLLPQSLGPFTQKNSIKVARKLAKKANSIYSREFSGREYFEEATGQKVKYCPDITFNLKVDKFNEKNQGVLIIPNFQVQKREGKSYIENLTSIIKYILKSEKSEVKLLNHEGVKDQIICEEIRDKIFVDVKTRLEILNPVNGIEAKREIASSELVITSRYHGLISALSQQIPVACYGWSFKYNDAISRFNLPKFNLSKVNEKELDKILSNEYASLFFSEEYKEELDLVQSEVMQMWANVFE